jgi:hypothetical protein
MKRLVLVAGLLMIAGMVTAGDKAKWSESEEVQSATISHSSWTWTRVPSSSAWNDKQRIGIMFDLENSCTDYLLFCTTNEGTNGPNYPGAGKAGQTTDEGIKYQETDGPAYLEIPHNVYLWMSIKGDGDETLYYWQVRGNR